ncbi:hypothetical protein FNV43_RR07398 [Rhamnella rubrinervis]|uniref:SAP30-binding protein n=1 Tax=Rhamnella rubrinervis TaxID=2594499 RepID=A0A8K0HGJ1_9ROSA|nr:hypothetical protein FNV43_RR07398 [Rhamnella rubrinervis]
MASRKKSEGIALLSMYDDEEEDDEMEDVEEAGQEEEQREFLEDDDYREPRSAEDASMIMDGDRMVAGDSGNNDATPPVDGNENFTPDKGFGSYTPQQPQVPLTSPPMQQQSMPLDSLRSRRGTLTIVDYGHDEVAMSPEAEEGEIEGTGRVMFGAGLQSANGDFHDKTPPGTVQVLTTSGETTQLFDPSHSDMMNETVHDSEGGDATGVVLEEQKDADPLDKFLPPPPKAKCSEELQRKINKFLDYKKAGKSFNAEVRNRKDYRNPDFLLHAVRYQDIDQIGSCFSKDVFDPHGYDKSDYYEEIEADMRREMDRKEQERKKSQKVEFISGVAQAGMVATAPKINVPVPGVSSMAASALHSLPPADSIARDCRQNKKSKWDKVEGDRRNPLPSGLQDSISTAGAHATLLSANVGTGYMAFAQQRRREAEERRSSERKLDRRT